MIITKRYLRENPTHVFVFGDNLLRKGYGGAAILRDYKNSYGFITKKKPNSYNSSFFRPKEYEAVFLVEIEKLKNEIQSNPKNTYLISKLGSGLANRFNIFEKIIKENLVIELEIFRTVKFLW